MPSKALEVNIETSRVDVTISEKYYVLQDVMSRYYGVMEGVNVFLTELCHPYKNWKFIVKEARTYALDYYHVLTNHPKGPEGAKIFVDIFFDAINISTDADVRSDSADNLLLFMQKIIRDSGDELPRFLTALEYSFEQINTLDEKEFLIFVKSFYQISKLGKSIHDKLEKDDDRSFINVILIRSLRSSYSFWLKEEDPFNWFSEEVDLPSDITIRIKDIFQPISKGQLELYQKASRSLIRQGKSDSGELLEGLISLPGYRQIVEKYEEIPRKLLKASSNTGQGTYWKLIFLFRIMDTEGLSSIHEEVLRDINRTLSWLISNEKPKDIQPLIQKTFAILKGSVSKYPVTGLNCALNMGKAVYKTDESDLVDFFTDSFIDLGFQTPDMEGVGDDWQMKMNSAHMQNVRTCMELIELNPKWSKKLISSLIIYLSLGGVYIKDTDLFPRDITDFLNSDIGPIYNLAKQLTRLFPAYFNDIGAEGNLRDISTRLDEICYRKDVLIHFLRKQSHVESSNQIIKLMESTLEFWRTKKKENLKDFIPPNTYDLVDESGPYVEGVSRLLGHIYRSEELKSVTDLLRLDHGRIKKAAYGLQGVSDIDIERVGLAVSFYKLLFQKYNLSFLEAENYLKQIQPGAFPDIDKLKDALDDKDSRNKLFRLLSYLEKLKERILSSEEYEIKEDIYHKRHFTVDIPSMYGSYHEVKFDSLGFAFRLESLVNILFEELVDSIDLELITRETFSHIYDYLWLFYRALKLDGITSAEMERQLELLSHSLKVKTFSYTQFLDVFKGFSQAVKNIVNDYFDNIHQQNLIKIIDQIPVKSLLPRYRFNSESIDSEKQVHRVSEIFLRERMAASLGLQQLDLFLSRVMNTLFQQSHKLSDDILLTLLNYDPQKATTLFSPANKGVSDIIHLGNKGLNLVRLSNYGFPVPPGFIITTEVFRCREIIDSYPPADNNLKSQLAEKISYLEKATGKLFGDPRNPLLLSVRSGAPISQPGMMDTFLDVGINEDIIHGIIAITGQEWFAWDCYRRFMQSYGMAFGLKRNDFDDIMSESKQVIGVPVKRDFTGKQMKKLALNYKEFILDNGIKIEESPLEQLYITISKVFESWNTAKAKTYRQIMRISDDWGTAVTVQAMIFGNLTQKSGSGVVFTHSPRLSGDMISLWGDFTLGNQGEDVVSGLVKTLPISLKQAEVENRGDDITLETHFPEIYGTIRNLAKVLIYERSWGPQEMEFTFERDRKEDLYFLQTRDMAIRERKTVLSFVTAPDTNSRLLGHGIGVSGGAMTGRVVFNLEEIDKWREDEPETSLILVRGDTAPDDIKEIYEADGLLTARGGSTSHAAIVAHRLEKTCVVGCANLVCVEKESSCSLDSADLKSGSWVSIDGREGSIYSGTMEIEEVARR